MLANLRLWGTVTWCNKLELQRLAVIDLKTSFFSDYPNKGILFLLPAVRSSNSCNQSEGAAAAVLLWGEYQNIRNSF